MLCIKEVRVSKGISRYQLARLSGVNESTLQNIENSDDPNPTFKVLCKVVDALGITLDDLRRSSYETTENKGCEQRHES